MKRILLLGTMILGATGLLFAQHTGNPPGAPEIDPSQALSALALLSGSVLVIRGRRKN